MRELSDAQIEEVRAAIRAAAAGPHAQLGEVCARYVRSFGISYQELRQIVDVALPNYLAAVPPSPRKSYVEPPPTLSTEQTSALILAHRTALESGTSAKEFWNQLEHFAAKYRVKIYVLKRALAADEAANRELYTQLRAAGDAAVEEQRSAARAQRKAKRAKKGAATPVSRRKSPSVWTLGGGLPGQGKRQ